MTEKVDKMRDGKTRIQIFENGILKAVIFEDVEGYATMEKY